MKAFNGLSLRVAKILLAAVKKTADRRLRNPGPVANLQLRQSRPQKRKKHFFEVFGIARHTTTIYRLVYLVKHIRMFCMSLLVVMRYRIITL